MSNQVIAVRLPNCSEVEKELSYEEVCFWVSLGMYFAHGFHTISTAFAASQMDDEATVELDPEQDQAVN